MKKGNTKKAEKKNEKESGEDVLEKQVPESGRSRFRIATARGVAVYQGEWTLSSAYQRGDSEEKEEGESEIQCKDDESKEHESPPGEEQTGEKVKVQHGKGKLTFEDCEAEWFEGLWNEGRMVEGEYHFANGDVYTGGFNKKGQFEGYGKMVSNVNRYLYEGAWQEGKFHGQGVLTSEDLNLKWKGNFNFGQFVDIGSQMIKFKFDPMSLPPTLREVFHS